MPPEVIRIPLVRRSGRVVGYALADAADAELVAGRWGLHPGGYAQRHRNNTSVFMHRLLLGLNIGDEGNVDHINGDRLDNRRANLRVVRAGENLNNVPSRGGTSRYRGVSWDKGRNKWTAKVQLHGRGHFLGHFHSEVEAAQAAAAFRAEHMPHSSTARDIALEVEPAAVEAFLRRVASSYECPGDLREEAQRLLTTSGRRLMVITGGGEAA